MQQTEKSKRYKTLLLMLAVLFFTAAVPVRAETLNDATSVTISKLDRSDILFKTDGSTLGADSWSFTADDGQFGVAYCVNWGLNPVSPDKVLTIQPYNRSPKTMGAFANGYPLCALSEFRSLHPEITDIANLTNSEYFYATQVAVWATCGQLAVPGTEFTSGRATLAQPSSDVQQMRVFEAVQAILRESSSWTKHIYTGVSMRGELNVDGNIVDIIAENGLEGAAENGIDGIKRETINGQDYYTRTLYVSSATSTWLDGYVIRVSSQNAPSGTIFTNTGNTVLPSETADGVLQYKVPTPDSRPTSLNANGSEYLGEFKICIPVDSVADTGSITIDVMAKCSQYNLFIANNPTLTEQSYIISDPAYNIIEAEGTLKWSSTGSDVTTASVHVQKVDAAGNALEGAEFTLSGSKGTTVTGRSNSSGVIQWNNLPADETYTLTETGAPEGYRLVQPSNIAVTGGKTSYLTVRNSNEETFQVRKTDAQNGASLQGAVFRFEKIDGSHTTTGTTGFDGIVEFSGDELPYGSYRVTEIKAPEGYLQDTSVETVEWTGEQDVVLTFQNVREPGITIVKKDAASGVSLAGAAFDVYSDGNFITSVTTNSAGEARVYGFKQESYVEVVETAAPAGYVLSTEKHGIHIDPYNPAVEDDPVLVVFNRAQPQLRIMKYDAQTKQPIPDTTFEIYHNTQFKGSYTTDETGTIFLYNLEPGTYLVKEVSTVSTHVVNSTPQEIELKAGDTQTHSLVFLNTVKPGIYLTKLDSQTMAPLAGVRFSITRVGGTFSNEYVTDTGGEIDLTGLEPGSYLVKELEAPEGYVMDDAQRILDIEAGESAQVIFTNTKKPSLKVVKYGGTEQVLLPGAAFRVTKIEDSSRYFDCITGLDGSFVLENLEPGIYSVQEITPPDGYILNAAEYHVEVFAGQASQLVVHNDARPDLKIIKKDADTKTALKGAVFQIHRVESSFMTTGETDENGEILLQDLEPGVYQVTEVTPPVGYLPAEEKTQLITLEPNRTGTVIFENHVQPDLTVNKIDSVTGDPIPGAKFRVTYAGDGSPTDGIADYGYYYSDEKGQFVIGNLNDGWYRVEEVEAAPGYAMKAPSFQDFFIRKGESKTITFENTPLSAIIISKVDADTGQPVAGAFFQIRYLGGTSGTGGTVIGQYTTSINGTIVVTGLQAGTYIVEELRAADGYVMTNTAQTVYLSGNDQDVVTVQYGNERMGSLLIKKLDAVTHEPLSGVQFQVTASDGSVVGNRNGLHTTDAQGLILIPDLEPGLSVVVREVRTREGYILDDTAQTAKIRMNETLVLEFLNQSKGSLLIKKLDAVTREPLSGVQFKVMDSDGNVVGNSNGLYMTNADGVILIPGLEPEMTLVVQEVKAREGYVLDDTVQTIKLKSDETAILEFLNVPEGSLVIKKLDSVTHEPLSGVEFQVTTIDGTVIGNRTGLYTTDAAGVIIIPGIAPHTAVVVKETRTKDGYVLDDTAKMVTIRSDEIAELEFLNQPKGSLVIKKLDSVTHEPLSGVEFRVTTIDGTAVGNSSGFYVTDAGGVITISNLEPNMVVVVKETKTRDGYMLDDTAKTVTIRSGEAATLEFVNQPKGSLMIKKLDSITREPLSGVEFKVTTADGAVVGNGDGFYTTDAGGTAVVTGLEPGTAVVVRETKAKEGYILDDSARTVMIKSNEIIELEFLNIPKGSLIIRKLDGITHEPLSGVEFKVTTTDGMAAGNGNGFYVTDAGGMIVVTGLEPGTSCIVQETRAKEGYVLDDTAQTIMIQSNEAAELEFLNLPKGSLLIQKLDGVTREPLSGVQFQVMTADGAVVGDSNGLYVTDANGMITISNLEPNTAVIVRETKAKEGYVLDDTAQTVVIKSNEISKLEFLNRPKGSLLIKKLDAMTHEPLSGVQFKITTEEGLTAGSSNGLYMTDRNGTIVVAGLEPGISYVVRETQAKEGYVLDDTAKTVTIKSNEISELEFLNQPLGSLVIRKLDGVTHEPLSGVQFQVTASDGSTVGDSNGLFVTDGSGSIHISGLKPGTTCLVKEIRTIEGYILDDTVQTIQIQENQTAELEFLNQPTGCLMIQKLDGVTREPLSGVTFKIMTVDGTLIGNGNGLYTTDANGTILLTRIDPDTVVVVQEMSAKEGYILDDTAQTARILSDETVTLEFLNQPMGSLVIKKLDAATHEPLSGVEFKVTTSDGNVVGNRNGLFTTDVSGTIVISGLEPETTLIVQETKAKEGYILDDVEKTIQTRVGETVELEFFNQPLGSLIIKKLDAATHEPLSGVEFKVTTSDGNVVGNSNGLFTTDVSGTIVISGLEPEETYVVKETRAKEGYILDDVEQTIKIRANETSELEFLNQPKGSLIIKKLDSITHEPLAGVEFKVITADGTFVPNQGGQLSSNGLYKTDKTGQIILSDLVGTFVVTETRTIPGYIIDEETRTQTVVVNAQDTQILTFYNTPSGGLQIIKSDEDTGERLKGVQFEIRKMNGEILGTYTTNRDGVIHLPEAESGWYTVTERKAVDGYELDTTPEQICVKDGETATLEITNKRMSSIMLHKIDADTKEGIYGVTFVLYDAGKNPIGEYITDQEGYIWIDDELEAGKYYIRELEAAEGYTLDTQYKTVYVERGKCAQIEWENKAVTGQIQIQKYAEDNSFVTGINAGASLQGAVYEITRARSGSVVGYIVTDARGVAASDPLPLGRYFITEVSAPAYYQLNSERLEAEIEYPGQIIKLSQYDKAVDLGVTIKKVGNAEVQPGQVMRYDFSNIANTSNTALNNFYWHDRIPTDAARAVSITTGTYNQRLYYRAMFKTNLNDYQMLAGNLLTSNNYSLNLSSQALGLASGEYVTDIRLEFGTVASGFASVMNPTLQVQVSGTAADGYQIVNRADVGGQYLNEWQTALSSWITAVQRFQPNEPLPRTGY